MTPATTVTAHAGGTAVEPPVATVLGAEPLTVLAVVAFVIAAVVVVLCAVTVVIAVRERRNEQRRSEARRRVRGELFDRRRREDPAWDEWLAGLDETECDQLESLLDRFLRTVSGSEQELFLDLAGRLEMGRKADETLDSGAVVPRLRALARLSLLEYPVDGDRLEETCLDDNRTREAAARLVLERPEQFEEPAALGTRLLVWDGEEPMTARGLETLYELNDGNPEALVARADEHGETWSGRVLTQVCEVFSKCQMTPQPDWAAWVVPLFDHERARVRAGAVQAFRQVGWRERLREQVPFRTLLADDDPLVRRATYRVLAYWGDERARELLEWAVIDEDDPRAQLVAVRGLVSLEAEPMGDHPGWPAESWDWIRAEIAVTGRRRLPQLSRVTQV